MLDEAGWVDSDGDGVRDKMIDGQRVKFEFDIVVRDDPERVRWCELLKFNLDQIGIACNVKPMESTRLLERLLKKEFQAECGGWGTGSDPDQDENVWTTHAIQDGRNFLQYSNPEVDKLFDEAPPRIRSRQTGGHLRQDRRDHFARSALHVSVLARQLFWIQQAAARLQVQSARAVRLQSRLHEFLESG